MQTPLKTNRF